LPDGQLTMVCPNKGAGAPQPTGETKMKKMILLAAVLGLTAGLTAKGADAKENWTTICIKCHGAEGKGDTKMGQKLGCKDLTDAKVQEGFKDDAAIKALKEGLKSDDGKTLMKPFEQLSDDDIKALVAYVRTLKK
jgi:cytochrome c553